MDEAQSAAAHLSLETLPELRDACKALFVRELELRDECSAVARQTVGQDALRERGVSAPWRLCALLSGTPPDPETT